MRWSRKRHAGGAGPQPAGRHSAARRRPGRSGKRNDDGTRQAPEVSVGDKVLYSKYAGTDIKLGTDEYVLLSEKDILAVVN